MATCSRCPVEMASILKVRSLPKAPPLFHISSPTESPKPPSNLMRTGSGAPLPRGRRVREVCCALLPGCIFPFGSPAASYREVRSFARSPLRRGCPSRGVCALHLPILIIVTGGLFPRKRASENSSLTVATLTRMFRSAFVYSTGASRRNRDIGRWTSSDISSNQGSGPRPLRVEARFAHPLRVSVGNFRGPWTREVHAGGPFPRGQLPETLTERTHAAAGYCMHQSHRGGGNP